MSQIVKKRNLKKKKIRTGKEKIKGLSFSYGITEYIENSTNSIKGRKLQDERSSKAVPTWQRIKKLLKLSSTIASKHQIRKEKINM